MFECFLYSQAVVLGIHIHKERLQKALLTIHIYHLCETIKVLDLLCALGGEAVLYRRRDSKVHQLFESPQFEVSSHSGRTESEIGL